MNEEKMRWDALQARKADAIAETLEKYLGETIDNYYKQSKPKKEWKLMIKEKIL